MSSAPSSSPAGPKPDPANNIIFETAYAEFVASLPPDELALVKKCCSAEDLSGEVQSIPAFKHLNNSKRKKLLEHVNALSEALRPFTGILNLFVSSHPEWAAIIWGSINLLFQLASNFIEFFHRIGSVLDQISLKFPKYGTLATLMESGGFEPTPIIQVAIKQNYRSILSFFQAFNRVFLKKTGLPRSRIATTAILTLSPFKTHFDQLLASLEIYDQALRDELQILQLQQGQDHLRSFTVTHQYLARQDQQSAATRDQIIKQLQMCNDECKTRFTDSYADALRLQVRAWLDPPEFMDIYEVARSRAHGSSGRWFFEEKGVREWKAGASPPGNKRWVQGIPGAGKTTLAASFIDHLKDDDISIQPGSGRTILFYFFHAESSHTNTVVSACRAILAQILKQHWRNQEVMDRFSFAMAESSGQTTASRDEVTNLTRLCLSTIPDCFLVMDGIDECFEAKPTIDSLVATFGVEMANVMYFSRPSGPGLGQLYRSIAPRHRLRIDKSNSEDIEDFCRERLLWLVESGLLPELEDLESTLNRLVLGAGGMFLWARLVFNLLEGIAFVDPWDRLELVRSIETPEDLDKLFCVILKRLKLQGSAAVKVAVNIFAWILFSVPSDRGSSLGWNPAALRAGLYPEKRDPMPPIADFVQMATMICCSLLELDGFGHLSFVHLSVRDYLARLAGEARCKYILVNFPASSWSPGGLTRDTISSRFPLAAYAAAQWCAHASAILSEILQGHETDVHLASEHVNTLLTLLQRVLISPESISVWMELCFIFNVSMGSPGLSTAQNILRLFLGSRGSSSKRTLTADEGSIAMAFKPLLEVIEYMQTLYATWGEKLVQHPSIIWREAQIFGTPKSQFSLKEMNTVKLQNLTPDLPRAQQAGTELLRSVSALTTDQHMAVVTVWPSKYFCEVARLSDRNKPLSAHGQSLCSNWIAVYEEWTVIEPVSRQLSVCIPLDPQEVALQINQSGCLRSGRSRKLWSIQFPVTVSPEKRVFSVLRTVYRVLVSKNDDSVRTQGQVLPLDVESFDVSGAWTRRPILRLMTSESSAYLYNLCFSESGHYLYFLALEGTGPFHLCVFERNSDRGGKYMFRNQQRFDPVVTEESLFDVEPKIEAHPDLPLAAIAILGTVFLWDWTNDSQPKKASESMVDIVIRAVFSGCGSFLDTVYDVGSVGSRESLEDLLTPARLLALRTKHTTATENPDTRMAGHEQDSGSLTTLEVPHEKPPSSQLQVLSTSKGSSLTVSGESSGTPATICLKLENGTIALTRQSGAHSIVDDDQLEEAEDSAAELDPDPDRMDTSISVDRRSTTTHRLELLHLPTHLVESSHKMHVQLLMSGGGDRRADSNSPPANMTLIAYERENLWTTLQPQGQHKLHIPMVVTLPACRYSLNDGEDGKQQWQLEDASRP